MDTLFQVFRTEVRGFTAEDVAMAQQVGVMLRNERSRPERVVAVRDWLTWPEAVAVFADWYALAEVRSGDQRVKIVPVSPALRPRRGKTWT